MNIVDKYNSHEQKLKMLSANTGFTPEQIMAITNAWKAVSIQATQAFANLAKALMPTMKAMSKVNIPQYKYPQELNFNKKPKDQRHCRKKVNKRAR
jgi:hypothetical protein